LGSTAAGPSIIPLRQVATIRDGTGPAQIRHHGRERLVTVEANVSGRALSDVMRDIDARLATISVPQGYSIGAGGDSEEQREVFGRMLLAIGAALLLLYMILVIQFDSFLEPLAILLSLPLSLTGVMLALIVTGSTLNIMSMLGVVLLMGIVAKNAILLIDFAKTAMRLGAPRHDALLQAGATRLRPILMTSFAIIAGMIPAALSIGDGAELRAPLGRAVIGGVVTSTLLTLLVIPTVFDSLHALSEHVRNRLHTGQTGRAKDRTEPAREAVAAE
jgi:HAE1 family hydrophobic/amphiphilic exporter-1